MSEQTIRRALGKLQDNPELEEAWTELQDAVTDPQGYGLTERELLELLGKARAEHGDRHEDEAVAQILELELLLAGGSEHEAPLQRELARVLNEVLDEPKRAVVALERLLTLTPNDPKVTETIASIRDEQAHWPEILRALMDAAEANEGNPEAQAGLLYSAAQTAYRYGVGGSHAEARATRKVIIERLEEAHALAAGRAPVVLMLERLYRMELDFTRVARVLGQLASETNSRALRLAVTARRARVLRQMGDLEGAVGALEAVLAIAPEHDEALKFLVGHYSATGAYERLVALYERLLDAPVAAEKASDIEFQIAMIQWRTRGRPDLAEPHFERIRAASPTHGPALAFFREHLVATNDVARLGRILDEAQRSLREGPERAALLAEIATLNGESSSAPKSIEQWRAAVRGDPSNVQARDALRRLYARTEAWPALVDLLRTQIDRLPADDAARLPLLRELMAVHRDKTKQDTALISVLNQIVALVADDRAAIAEQVRVFEALNRPRDRVAAQTRLAELETDPDTRAELWRLVAREWSEKFANAQHAMDAYEKVAALLPADVEATTKLRELYTKRRAYAPLYALLGRLRDTTFAADRRELSLEMARLASEKLDRGSDAIALYWEVLGDDPRSTVAIDALEKQADRDKEFGELAKAIEHRVSIENDPDVRLKQLERLGALYEGRARDPRQSIATWHRVLRLRSSHPRALRVLREEHLALGDYDGLTSVYAEIGDWEGLAEALSAAADRSEERATKIDLSWRVAGIFTEKLNRPERASAAYERVLSMDSGNERALRAVLPIAELAGSATRVIELLEQLAAVVASDEERAQLLWRAVDVASESPTSAARVFPLAARAFAAVADAPARAKLRALADRTSSHAALVEALLARRARLEVPSQEAERRTLTFEAATLLSESLDRTPDAVTLLRDAVEHDANDDGAVHALDALLRRTNDGPGIRALFATRLERAESIETQHALLVEWSTVECELFGDPARALTAMRRARALQPDSLATLSALARLEATSGDPEAALAALESERELADPADYPRIDVAQAELLSGKLARPRDALSRARRALDAAPHTTSAVAVLESLRDAPDLAIEVGGLLADEYAYAGRADAEVETLQGLIALATGPERRALLERLADVHAEKRADPSAAVEALIAATSDAPNDLPLWDRLIGRAGAAGRVRDVADALTRALATDPPIVKSGTTERELCARVATMLEERLSDADAAIPYLERILDSDPTDNDAFSRLRQLFTARERWDALQRLYETVIAGSDDAGIKLELLSESALVYDDILDAPEKAILAHEHALAIDSTHAESSRALEKLYERTGRFKDLAALLQRAHDAATYETRAKLDFRLAQLYLEKLDDPANALIHAAATLERDATDPHARAIAEAVLTRHDPGAMGRACRMRSAEVLEPVYVALDASEALDGVLSLKLREAGDDLSKRDRCDLLRRSALLREERLHDDARALAVLAELVPLDPIDSDARASLLEVGRRVGDVPRVAAVLAAAVEACDDVPRKAEILLDRASLLDRAGDEAGAEASHRAIVALGRDAGPTRQAALGELERMQSARDDFASLAETLALTIDDRADAFERRELWGRLARIRQERLGDDAGALSAWRARLAIDGATLDTTDDDEALAAIAHSCERADDHRGRIAALLARVRLTQDGVARRALRLETARVHDRALGELDAAIGLHEAVLDEAGADDEVLGALAELQARAGRPHDVATTLERHLEVTTEPTARVSMLARLGALRLGPLAAPAAGLDVYREALALDPANATVRAALEELLTRDDVRGEAAAILRPLYEADGAWAPLLRALTVQASTAPDSRERREYFADAVKVAEIDLLDPAAAFAFASQGLDDASTEDDPIEIARWLEHAERLTAKREVAGDTTAIATLVERLRAVEPSLEGDQQTDVRIRIADLAREKLGDPATARQYFVAALSARDNDAHALEALDVLLGDAEDWPAQARIVRRRADEAHDPAARIALLLRLAHLSDDKVGDRAACIVALEQIVDSPAAPLDALVWLERCFADGGRWSDAAALLERQIAGDGVDGATPRRSEPALRHALAVVARTHLDDVSRALDELEAAVSADPHHAPSLETLESLLDDSAARGRAAEVLEPLQLAASDWAKLLRSLEVRLGESGSDDDRRTLLERIATIEERDRKDLRAALSARIRLLAEDPLREETWLELERIARSAGLVAEAFAAYDAELAKIDAGDAMAAQLAVRAGRLAELVDDRSGALRMFRRAHEVDPQDLAVFEAIDALLSGAESVDARIAHQRAALDHRTDSASRRTLLRTIASLHRDVRNDDDAAISALREAIELDESDSTSLDDLQALLTKTARYPELGELLERRAESDPLPARAIDFRMQHAAVLDFHLDDPNGAVDRYALVLAQEPQNPAAVAALESMLPRAALKARAVELLRPVYEAGDDWKSQIRLNGERLALAQDAIEKASILRETARLWEARADDRRRAFASMREAWVIDPNDTTYRAETERLAQELGDWDALVDAFELVLKVVDEGSRPEMLLALSTLHDARRDDPRASIATLERLQAIDPDDLEVLEKIDALGTMLGDWTTLDRVLERRANVTQDPIEQGALFRRLGELRAEVLEDPPRAIYAYERALDVDADHVGALDALIALREKHGDDAALVQLYRRRVALTPEGDVDTRHSLLVRRAERSERGLGDRRDAIEALRDADEAKPGDLPSTLELERLYEAEAMWADLHDSLKDRAPTAADAPTRARTRARAAAIAVRHLEDPAGALELYREVLADVPTDGEAIEAVRAIAAGHEELRATCVEIVDPALQAADRHADRVALLTLRLAAEKGSLERTQTRREIARVHEHSLLDLTSARASLLSAFAETPDDPELRDEIARVVAAESSSAAWLAWADAVAVQAENSFDPALSQVLWTTLGEVSEVRLFDDARAADAFARALDHAGDDAALLGALDRLYGRLGRHRPHAEVLSRRVDLASDATDGAARSELRARLATLQLNALGAAREALSTVRTGLEEAPAHAATRALAVRLLDDDALFEEACEALDAAYRASAEYANVATLYGRRIDRLSGNDRTRMRLELAHLLEEHAHDAGGAQRQIEIALLEDPSDLELLVELERLAPVSGSWATACEALAKYLTTNERLGRDDARDLWMKLGSWRLDRLDDPRGAEDAFLQASGLDAENDELLATIEALERVPGRERDLVATLRRRAALAGGWDDKRTKLREAHAIATGTLDDGALGEAILRDVLSDDPADAWALEALCDARAAAGDHEESLALLQRRAEIATEPAEQSTLRHRAARLARVELKRPDQAIALYQEMLDASDGGCGDEVAIAALSELYVERGRHIDRAQLLERRIDHASDASDASTRTRLRLELAALQSGALGKPTDGVETLRAILAEDAGSAAATVALGELLTSLKRFDELAELLELQLRRAVDGGDVAAEIALQMRLGALSVTQLRDDDRAVTAYGEVLARDPSHIPALRALLELHERRRDESATIETLAKLVAELARIDDPQAPPLALKLAGLLPGDAARDGRLSALRSAMFFADRMKDAPTAATARATLRVEYEGAQAWSELLAIVVSEADAATTPAKKAQLLREAAAIQMERRASPGEAAELLERAIAAVPDDRPTLLLLCDAYSASGRGADAALALRKVIDSFGGKRSKELAVYHHRLGLALDSQGERESALQQLDQAFKIDPGNVTVLRDLGRLALTAGQLEQAQKTFRALLLQRLDASTGITKGQVFFYLGEVALAQEDPAKALQMYERAVETEPGLGAARDRITELRGAGVSARPPASGVTAPKKK